MSVNPILITVKVKVMLRKVLDYYNQTSHLCHGTHMLLAMLAIGFDGNSCLFDRIKAETILSGYKWEMKVK